MGRDSILESMTIKNHTGCPELALDEFLPHPKNPNRHDSDQIERLAELYRYHGIRHPIIISRRSGCIVAGHGRLMAARKAGLEAFPYEYQDFDSDEAEYAFLVADNAIADLAELDLSQINMEIGSLGPDFDLDNLGIKDFRIDAKITDLPDLEATDPDCQQVTFTLSNEQKDELDAALEIAAEREDCSDGINQNKNGNRLAAIVRAYRAAIG